MKTSILTSLFIILLGITASSQTKKAPPSLKVGSAEWLVKMYFLEEHPPDLKPYLAGEMLKNPDDPPIGTFVPSYVKVTYRLIEAGAEQTVYAVTSRDSSGIRDMYCFLKKNGPIWQIIAIMWSSSYDYYPGHVAELKARATLDDSLRTQLTMMQLAMASDSALKVHFTAHKKAYDSLATLIGRHSGLMLLKFRCGKEAFAMEQDSVYAKVCPLMESASVFAIYHGTQDCPAGTFFEVGGLNENTTGYLYVPEGAVAPPMSYDRFYLLEKVAPHWYLYKSD